MRTDQNVFLPLTVLAWAFCLLPSVATAQDDLLELLQQEEAAPEKEYTYATFKSNRLINGQTVELTSGGELNFVIGHRFGQINDGWYEFWGLDQATIRLGLEYGLWDRLNIGIGRSSYKKTVDGYLKAKLIRQSTGPGSSPVSVVFFSNMAMNGLKWENPDRTNYFSSRLSYAFQFLLARKFSESVSLQLMPSMVHRNLVATADDPNDVFALGFGGRVKVSRRISINGEYYYQLPSTRPEGTFNSVALGVDIETGGHVFQLHVTNSKGMVEQYFIAETLGDPLAGDLYFGFNINRVFTIDKKKNNK